METLGLLSLYFRRDRYMSYYGREWFAMLKNIKKHVLKAMYNYHYHMSNHYGCCNVKGLKHVRKEFELVNKIVIL